MAIQQRRLMLLFQLILRSAAMLLKQRLRTLHLHSTTSRRQSPATIEGAGAGAVDEMTSADLRLRFVPSNTFPSGSLRDPIRNHVYGSFPVSFCPLGFQSVPFVFQNTLHESEDMIP